MALGPTEARVADATGALVELPAGVARAVGGAFHTGKAATEPTIVSDGKDGIYMTAITRLDLGATGRSIPTVVATFDHGQNWTDVGPYLAGTVPAHPSTNDPMLVSDPATGRVFMDDILPLSCNALSWTDDQGATWTTNPYACGNSNVNDHQTLTAAKPRVLPTATYPNLVYTCKNNVAYVACATSLDGGLTFGPQVPVTLGATTPGSEGGNSPDVCGSLTGHIKSGPDGTVYLPKGHCGIPTVFVSQDDGLTWDARAVSTSVPMNPGEHEVSVAIAADNTVYATWVSSDFLQLAWSHDGGHTWSQPLNVTAPGVTGVEFNAVASVEGGRVAFAYLGTTVPGGYSDKPGGTGGLAGDVLGEPDPPEWANATWNAYLGVILDTAADNPVIQTVTANDPADPLARGLCGHTRCHGMNDFIDLTVDPEGRPWAAFVDVCTESCVKDPKVHFDHAVGLAATLVAGPSLRTGDLAPIAPPPVKA